MSTSRWRRRPEGSTWGDFGPDDQLGRANLLTPERVRQAVAEVREGLVFCLSLPLDLPGGNKLNPRRFPPQFSPTGPAEKPRYTYPLAHDNPAHTDVVCDDRVLMALQYSTQWDSLAHVGGQFDIQGNGRPEPVFYNGYRAGTDIVGPIDYEKGVHTEASIGARRLGIENMAAKGMQGRGVLIDLRAHLGDERTFVGYDALMRIMEQDKVVVETGDMLCLHTGFGQRVIDMGGDPDEKVLHGVCAVLDGRDQRLQKWIADSGIAALIADNYAVEGLPARPASGERHAMMPLHELCLFKLGLNLGELWYLTELAGWLRGHGRSRFLLTAPPLRLPGAVGSPATPIATV